MHLLPNQTNFELIFKVWLHRQIEQLSTEAARANITVRLTHFDFHDTEYLIEHRGKITHYSPEEAYAMLHFYMALDELEMREEAETSVLHQC